MNKEELKQIAQAMVKGGKGVLAADESSRTIKKRLESVGIQDSEENRRAYRDLLLSTSGLEEYISGVILYDETFWQTSIADGIPFPKLLLEKGILPGIKTDTGAKDLALYPNEKVTEGLDGLRDRFEKYASHGAKFTKWRAVIRIGEGIPTDTCIKANCHALTRYSALAQEAGIVPMVEPEILIEGDHTIETCYQISAKVWKELFKDLTDYGVYLPGVVLKTSMVIAGKEATEQSSIDQVAEMTVKCLKESVPEDLAGVVFLSGGQSPIQSTEHLNAMNKLSTDLPWPLSFSYGRALQEPALAIWGEDQEKVDLAREALLKRAKLNALATKGEYDSSME